jgi:Arc/MetJ-type ribon-helix-helix transcriptional regulator
LTAAQEFNIVFDMKTISVSVSEDDYEAFRVYAKKNERSIADLVREAMRLYRQRLGNLSRLESLIVLETRPLKSLPHRTELYDEMGERHF